MKLCHFAAAAMLLAGGSALAYSPDAKDEIVTAAGKGAQLAAFKAEDKAFEPAKPTMVPEKPVAVPASAVSWDKADPMPAGDPDLDLAEVPKDAQPAVGGPLEEVETAALGPRPASQNYPACSPGPGDDNCIQLYEPGVETALASWTAPTGGLAEPGEALAAATTTESLNAESLAMASAQLDAARADGTALASAETGEPAMGGPYEPVGDELTEAEAHHLAMNGDGVVDEELGETEDLAAV